MRNRFASRFSLFGALLVFAAALFGCGKEPGWRFERQVVDQSGGAISNAEVRVSTQSDPHGFRPERKEYLMRTDENGRFHLDGNHTYLFLTVKKAGYIPKEYRLHRERDLLRGPPSGEIILSKSQTLPAPDDFDRRGEQELSLHLTNDLLITGINFLDGHLVQSTDLGSMIIVRKQGEQLNVVCQGDCSGAPISWETGITVDSWKASHAVINEASLTREFTIQPISYLGLPILGGFAVKAQGSWIRGFVLPVGSRLHVIRYDLSTDEFFVRETQSAGPELSR